MRLERTKLSPFDPVNTTGLESGLYGDWGVAIRLQAGCVNRCLFCHGYREPAAPTSAAEVEELLSQRPSGPLFFFGEVLNHPNLLELLDAAVSKGFKSIELQATGEELADPLLVSELAERVRSVSFAIYGIGELHDRLVGRPGSFELIQRALKNLREQPALKVYLHSVLLSANVGHIERIRRLAEEYGHPFCLLPLDPKPEVPSLEKLLCSFTEAVRINAGSELRLVGFPLCVTKEISPRHFDRFVAWHRAEPDSSRWRVPEGVSDVTFGYARVFRLVYPPKCGSCAVKDCCPGVSKRYLDRFGDAELEPLEPAGARA